MCLVILLISNFHTKMLFDPDRQITSFCGHLELIVTDDLKVECNQGAVTMVIVG